MKSIDSHQGDQSNGKVKTVMTMTTIKVKKPEYCNRGTLKVPKGALKLQ
jgi:hypothetical protein